ncbi:uncharacterized protein LOC119685089 [Teleopsis dalmanni]|uniref:uncharacterized protein LOC119685089 n=1 Tax=Teleopsis dalmanni TaxID=139649 RepID=UPI000D32A9FE|nr:uncharacterized protein LOC119685089 [Teleopsis dalmanni]
MDKSFLLRICLTLFYLFVIQADQQDVTITCDFDLPNLEDMVLYLPEKCQEIYNERNTQEELFNLYIEESKQFGQFFEQLDTYEKRNSTNEELTVYPFEAKLRQDIYTTADLTSCLAKNETEEIYLQCLIEKRKELLNVVPTV